MSLLPKSSEEFSSKEYWNQFFTKRGQDPFEWYGDFADLCKIYIKYMKLQDKIIISGCGNSSLSAQLYKLGYKSISNVDVSEVVIRQMKEKHKIDCPGMVWHHGDVLNLVGFQTGTFSCVLDKGTLDALMSDESDEVTMKAEQYFKELSRVLRVGGRFICISLLQEHILRVLTKWFPANGWMMRFCRCEEAEKAQLEKGLFCLPVFAVVCTKFNKTANFSPILELSLHSDSTKRAKSVTEISDAIVSLQHFAVTRNNLRTNTKDAERTHIELCDPETSKVRYSLYVIDNPKPRTKLAFAVFIVPQGSETDFLFASPDGQKQLAETSNASRLIVVHLNRDQTYVSLANVQKELSAKVLDLAPPKMPLNYQVPFLSVGNELGERTEIHRGKSVYSGDYLIEDIKSPQCSYTLRRLIFLSSPTVIQSEAKLVQAVAKGRKNRSVAQPLLVDRAYLSCSHHLVMTSSLQMVSHESSVLLVGLGGGLLAGFIRKYFPKASVVAVDIDKAIVEVARKWFSFADDNKLSIVVNDGVQHIIECEKDDRTYDVIMIDVDAKDRTQGLSCPPKPFVELEFLGKVLQCLTPRGMFVLNVVCRDVSVLRCIVKDIKTIFSSVVKVQIPDEVNCIFFCRDATPSADARSDFAQTITTINTYLKQQQKVTDDVMDIDDLINNFQAL